MIKDYHILPRLEDSISYLYFEHAIIRRDDSAIIVINREGKTKVPIASLTCLLLGPGVSITHSAIVAICESGCMVEWVGENVSRFYAAGMGETRSSKNLLMQAELCMDKEKHVKVAKRMYEIRFPKLPDKEYTLQQLRGMEGIRVKQAYKLYSQQYGVEWSGRYYKKSNWSNTTPINKAISIGNALLYAICHSAIVSLGCSPGLGFVHTGKSLSFVYDIADLYKADITIPSAFAAVKYSDTDFDSRVRNECRKRINNMQLLKRIPGDISRIFEIGIDEQQSEKTITDLWNEDGNISHGGRNYGTGDDEW